MLAREAEEVNRSQRRQQLYSGVGGKPLPAKREMAAPWVATTIVFPSPAGLIQHIRHLHVWGRPHWAVDQTTLHVWPKHLVRPSSPSPPPACMPAPSPYSATSPYWFPPHYMVLIIFLLIFTHCYFFSLLFFYQYP